MNIHKLYRITKEDFLPIYHYPIDTSVVWAYGNEIITEAQNYVTESDYEIFDKIIIAKKIKNEFE